VRLNEFAIKEREQGVLNSDTCPPDGSDPLIWNLGEKIEKA